MHRRFFVVVAGLALAAACTSQIPRTAPPEAIAAPGAAAAAEPAPNPFFEEWTTPFGVPPFGEIRNEHYLPAIEKGIAEEDAEIEAIAARTDAPTFANTVEAMDRAGELLNRVVSVFFEQRSANTSEEIQKIAEQAMPLLAKHQDDILLNERLFARLEAVYAQRDSLTLTPEQRTLLEEDHKDFVRGGIALSAGDKQELRKINEELALLTLKFDDNLIAENNRFELVIEKREELAGLPERVVEGAAEAAKRTGREGAWVFTLDKPSLIPFLQFSDRRDLREKMFRGYVERGDHGDGLDNKENLARIVELRIRKAKLLGFETYADFVLDRRMAKTADAVYRLLDEVWKAALPVAKREAKELGKLLREDDGKAALEPWDWWYYAEKLRAAKYDLDDNELRPYFSLENVRTAAFDLAGRLYGIRFVRRDDLPRSHPDAVAFEVLEADGRHLGVFFTDYFPRPSKEGGAWCGGYREEHVRDGKRVAPLVTNVGNFSMPAAGKPALLSFEEVTTLFHEFGHALHSLFTDVAYRGSSANVKTDFVELPSQIMENWAIEPAFLKTYARHYETNAPIPDDLVRKIERARHFNEGFATVEFVAACYLDMAWHTLKEPPKDDVRAFEKKVLDGIGLIPEIVVRYRSPYFAHIFSGDYYSAGYYSYLWSEVLDADAFGAFKEAGLYDAKTAKAFRDEVLARAGAEDPMALYVRFRGREPSTKPMLRRKGFLR